jgi:hypothetical protein
VNILSLFRRRPARGRRVLTPAEARAQQAAALNAQARPLQQAHGAAQTARPRREGDGRQAARHAYLAAHGVEKSFGGRMVVKGVTLYVRRGEAVGLLGPNGAGKTTVFYMITGLINADRGRIELDGYDVTALPMYQRARLGIGYLPQEASIFVVSMSRTISAQCSRWWSRTAAALKPISMRCSKSSISPVSAKRRPSRFPAVNGGAWKLRAHWRRDPVTCFSTSRLQALIRLPLAISRPWCDT